MPVQRPQLVNNEIYHIIVRGVGDSLIFRNTQDRYRTIFSLYEFNNDKPIVIREQRRLRAKKNLARELFSGNLNSRRDVLVEILAFCFMPNHIHLLLRQVKNNGISHFMRKFGAGYASYFNQKYNRRGHLFQGRFRAVHIKSTEQLKTVFAYIHTNCLSLIEPKWKENGIKDSQRAVEFLENDRWSSYQDYIGRVNFPSVTERQFLSEIMGGPVGCRKYIKELIKSKKAINFNNIGLEE